MIRPEEEGGERKEEEEKEEGEPWHLRSGCHCIEVSSAEVIRTLMEQEQAAQVGGWVGWWLVG